MMKYLLLVLICALVVSINAELGPTFPPSTTAAPTTTPAPTTPYKPTYCCNKCPPVKVTIKTVYKTKVFTVNVPYPVFKPLGQTSLTKCPPKFKKVSARKCVHYVKSTSTCPPGYFRVSDESCLKVVILPAKHPEFKIKCPVGYKPFGELGCKIGEEHKKKNPKLPEIIKKQWKNELVKIDFPEPKETLKCPIGYVQKGKYHCVKTIRCPKGYKKNRAGYCKRQRVKCPTGYTRLGRQCIKNLTVCPRGYKFNKKSNCCVKGTHKVYKDKCATVKCAKPNCPHGQKVIQRPGQCCLSCTACKCSGAFNPVCGNDGITYKNSCAAKCLGATITSEGACPNKCPKGNKCPFYYRPVCGSDGVTYTNTCSANVKNIKITSKSSCKKADCPKKK